MYEGWYDVNTVFSAVQGPHRARPAKSPGLDGTAEGGPSSSRKPQDGGHC